MEKNDSTKSKSAATDAERMTEIQKVGRLRLSAYNFEVDNDIRVLEDHPFIPQPVCHGMGGIDLGGGSMTDSLGRITWRLSNFVCREPERQSGPVEFPVSFVATPLIDKPVYITTSYKGRETQPKNDLILEVYSWDRLGEPAPYVPFYWRCRIPTSFVIT